MLKASHLSFRHAGAVSPAISDVSFTLEKGMVMLLCGCNGAGKSTLLKLLAGLIIPSSGTVSLAHGRPSLILQDPEQQILGSTVLEDLLLPWSHPTESMRAKALSILEDLDLEAYADHSPHVLSGGQKRRLCIASALMEEPGVLLMDEPASGLDYPGCVQLAGIIAKLRCQGASFIIATHDPVIFLPAMRENDRIIILKSGRLCLDASTEKACAAMQRHPEWGVRPCHA